MVKLRPSCAAADAEYSARILLSNQAVDMLLVLL
jgi:hypothetical protein